MDQEIIQPIATELLTAELSDKTFLRRTNKGGNEIHVVDAHTAPNVMKEIGRLREEAFRAAGGGTGKDCDIDQFDTMPVPCHQLIVWDPDDKIILGGYRFITGKEIAYDENGIPEIAMSHLFNYSDHFLKNLLPATIELGRSFVRLEYQSTRAGAKALFVLDNLWDGLGALTVLNPEIEYLFGKVTMYPGYHRHSRNLLLYFLNKHFADTQQLVTPIHPLAVDADLEELKKNFVGNTYAEDYKILNKMIRSHGYNIPPLVNAYMSLSPTMKVFGTAINDEFGDVEETGIFLKISEILEEKKQRHIGTFQPTK